MPDKGACRGCGRDILWIKNENGKAEPFDAKPTRVLVLGSEEPGVFETANGWQVMPGHINHFLTCPKAQDFRKKKEMP